MDKRKKRAPQNVVATLKADLAKWRTKALELPYQNANLRKFVAGLSDALAKANAQSGTSEQAEREAWVKKAMAVLIPTPGYTRSYTEIEAELRASGIPIPPDLKMLAAAERDEEDDPRIAGLKWRPKRND